MNDYKMQIIDSEYTVSFRNLNNEILDVIVTEEVYNALLKIEYRQDYLDDKFYRAITIDNIYEIGMDLDLEDIQKALSKAGYVLSKSFPNDVIIMYMLENELRGVRGRKRLLNLNELLLDLNLPLLMARSKEKEVSNFKNPMS
ncbi:MAG: hypothetical protein FWF57_09730 [Defluviitaleaceae bacterium]|nr:hypothetical protein [Defluviitaleaceae bacterium]